MEENGVSRKRLATHETGADAIVQSYRRMQVFKVTKRDAYCTLKQAGRQFKGDNPLTPVVGAGRKRCRAG